MGELGAATDPDANSQYWNSSKYAFAYSQGAVTINYVPWLRKIVNDIYLASVSGYWKIGSQDLQAVSASLRYFSLGDVTVGNNQATINPYEMAVDIGYSRKLSTKYSMGIVFRYIYSAMGYDNTGQDANSIGASAFAADINGYFTYYPIIGRNECQWSWGWNISNIGSKLKYEGQQAAFLPANLRIGTAFTFPLADYHNLTFGLDLNKLLVPAKPRAQDFINEDGSTNEQAYQEAEQEWEDMSSFKGIFKSFGKGYSGKNEFSKKSPYHSERSMLTTTSFSSVPDTSTNTPPKETDSISTSVPDLLSAHSNLTHVTLWPLPPTHHWTRHCGSRSPSMSTASKVCLANDNPQLSTLTASAITYESSIHPYRTRI